MFQSTPLCEGRQLSFTKACYIISFNPRPCARGDKGNFNLLWESEDVSIHAPVRGATKKGIKGMQSIMFQSTPLCEGRPSDFLQTFLRFSFQSTPLCEGRQLLYNLLQINCLLTVFCDPITKQFKKYSIVKELFYNSPA